jgi:hypothetical protein
VAGFDLRNGLDRWFPTLLRYVGLALTLWEPFIDSFNHPPVFFGGLALAGLKEFWPNGGGGQPKPGAKG